MNSKNRMLDEVSIFKSESQLGMNSPLLGVMPCH